MPKYEVNVELAFSGFLEKTFKTMSDSQEEAQEKIQKLVQKFLNSLPINVEDVQYTDIQITELTNDELVYKYDSYNQFVSDMEQAGLEVEDYHGRFHYHGPAVRCDDPSEVTSKTSVSCQTDSMGLGYIVYPR